MQREAEVLWFALCRPSVLFQHHRSGELVRHYEEVWSQLDGLEARTDFGKPVLGEKQLLEGAGIGAIAEPLGLRGTPSWDRLRVYEINRGSGDAPAA